MKESLTVSLSTIITGVSVFDVLGQEVITKTLNSREAQISMSQLANGTYFAKVTSENGFKIVKVLKQ